MQINQGGCLCSAIRFRISGQPIFSVVCHCASCGSQITYETAESPATIDITTASLDNPTLFPPTSEVWLEHKVPWHSVDPTRAHFPRGNL